MPAAPHPPGLQNGPNCWQCRFFAVSHVPTAPYACRAMGFQSRVLPALEVLRTDGQFCRSFLPKTPVQPNGFQA
jgi:hypothetical protein